MKERKENQKGRLKMTEKDNLIVVEFYMNTIKEQDTFKKFLKEYPQPLGHCFFVEVDNGRSV